MKPKRHPSARTTPKIRKAIQSSALSVAELARRYKVNRKTIAKWRARTKTCDAPMGPKAPRRALCLEPIERDFVEHYRRATGFTLDACLARLRQSFPELSRSALHRCLKAAGLGRRRSGTRIGEPARRAAGSFVISVHRYPSPGAFALFAAIDQATGVFFLRWRETVNESAAIRFLKIIATRFDVRTVTTFDEPPFAYGPEAAEADRTAFSRACDGAGIAHVLQSTRA
jgi:hypothetical protein